MDGSVPELASVALKQLLYMHRIPQQCERSRKPRRSDKSQYLSRQGEDPVSDPSRPSTYRSDPPHPVERSRERLVDLCKQRGGGRCCRCIDCCALWTPGGSRCKGARWCAADDASLDSRACFGASAFGCVHLAADGESIAVVEKEGDCRIKGDGLGTTPLTPVPVPVAVLAVLSCALEALCGVIPVRCRL